MAKAVFTTKINPTYDDLPEERYHFPKRYLGRAEKALRDWIVYYEPRRSSSESSSKGGRQSYFATARLNRIEQDPCRNDHYYAFVDCYLEFDFSVPFKEDQHYYETSLRRDDGHTNKGAFGQAVRIIPDYEYELILKAGFAQTLGRQLQEAESVSPDHSSLSEVAEISERPIIERVISRPFREAAFSGTIKGAYHNTCAMSGLKIVNGGGRTEVQAAHIQPVAKSGPDSPRNGIALSGTVHWMFDRGLISIEDDYSILISKGHLPDAALRLLTEDRRLILPEHDGMKPHHRYLRYHRENIYKG